MNEEKEIERRDGWGQGWMTCGQKGERGGELGADIDDVRTVCTSTHNTIPHHSSFLLCATSNDNAES